MGKKKDSNWRSLASDIKLLTSADCFYIDFDGKEISYPEETGFCGTCRYEKCSCTSTHAYGCRESVRWDGKYVYFCPLGLTFTASPVANSGCIVAGPVIIGDADDTLAMLPDKTLSETVAKLPVMEASKVSALSEVLSRCVTETTVEEQELYFDQRSILAAMYDSIERTNGSREIISCEKKLTALVREHDSKGMNELLNEILGKIYCESSFEPARIKARLTELIVILSRAVIDAGADINEILMCNTSFLTELDEKRTLDETGAWIAQVLNRFVNYTIDFEKIKHSDMVYRVMLYVRQHYSTKLTLDELAKQALFSRTYLSSVFKRETGQTLFSYINSVRVEKAKNYLKSTSISLAEIALMTGFEDQSYFSRVFKDETGMSPRRFRELNR